MFADLRPLPNPHVAFIDAVLYQRVSLIIISHQHASVSSEIKHENLFFSLGSVRQVCQDLPDRFKERTVAHGSEERFRF